MISRLRGVVRERGEHSILLDVQGVCYEVLMPPSILTALDERVNGQGEAELITFHYQQLEVGRGIPMLIGFLNEIEREFFIRFISVSGVGPKAALRALTLPIPLIAQAIDAGDVGRLRSLPGIGEQRAKEIVAKLQGKVGKYALIQSRGEAGPPSEAHGAGLELQEEAVAVLVQLQYKQPDAKRMVQTALQRNPTMSTVEEVLNEVYRQQRGSRETAPSPAAQRPTKSAVAA